MAQIAPGLQAGPPLATLSGPAPLSPSHRLQMGLEGATVSDSKPFLTGLGSGTEPRSGSALQPAGSPKHVPESEDPPEAPGTAERNGGPISESLSEPSPLTQDGRASVGCVGQSSSLPLPKSSLYSDLCPAMGLSTAKSIPGSSSGANPIPSSTPGPLADSILMPPPDSSVGSVSGTNSAPNSMLCRGIGSLSSLGPGIPYPRSTKPQALDTLSYLDSVSMMSGTMESLTGTGLGDDASSMGSDSEINGMGFRKTDRYGFLGGNQTAGGERSIPVEVARQRELKWLDMFKHWDKWILHRFQKVKLRCRKGIPSSLRAKAWQYLSNSIEHLEKNPGKFEELERQPGDPKWLDIIEKDLHRQFPFHEMFAARGGHGQQDLYRILKAYTIYKPDEGYCQAQAPVAAVLLMHMPAEQAFWCLVQICEKYLPGYYSAGLEAIQLDGEIFFALLRRVSSMAYRHLKRYKIDPILYMTEWFMCIFSRTLPWSSVLRIWDMFFCEGVKIVFRVGLVLLRSTLGARDKLRDCQGMYETMEKLRNIPMQYMQEDLLAYEVINLQVTEALIERENAIQRKKWEESRGALQHKPSRRLYGSRAIYEEKYRMNPPLSASASLLSLTSLKKFKEDKKDRQWMFRDQASFSPMHSVSNLAAPPDNHPLPPSPTLSLTFNSTARPAKEEKKKEIESGKQKQKGKDKAEKESKKPLLSMDKPSHEAPELTSQVVSEGLRPSLPSPTANITPLGEPKKNKEEKKKEKELEKQRAKEQKEKEKEMLKQLKLEKEKEKKLMKEKGKEEAKFKKEKKSSKQKDQPETTEISKDNKSQKGETKENGASSAKVVSEKGDLQGPIEAATTSALAQTPADNQNASGSSSNRNSAGMLQDTYF